MLNNHVLTILAFEASMFIWARLLHFGSQAVVQGGWFEVGFFFTALGGRCGCSQFIRV